MCIIEDAGQKEGDVRLSFVSICPATADVVWDAFEGDTTTLWPYSPDLLSR